MTDPTLSKLRTIAEQLRTVGLRDNNARLIEAWHLADAAADQMRKGIGRRLFLAMLEGPTAGSVRRDLETPLRSSRTIVDATRSDQGLGNGTK